MINNGFDLARLVVELLQGLLDSLIHDFKRTAADESLVFDKGDIRFYAGGIGSMRGFDFRGISPRQGLRKNRVGGDFLLLSGAEYTFPLYAKIIRGVFFLDMGTVEKEIGISTWRASIGGGIRLTLEIFGTVPMEFDLALPISEADEDDERVFSFFIGLPFF